MSTSMMTVEERREHAKRALVTFKQLISSVYQPILRAVTKNPKLKVEPTANMSATDKKTVWLMVPWELGETREHDRSLCDLRDEDYQMLCPACHVRDCIDSVVFHESAHISSDSFEEVDPEKYRDLVREFAPFIDADSLDLPWQIKGQRVNVQALTLFTEKVYLPQVQNIVEDIYVNRRLFQARVGTEPSIKGMIIRTFKRGYHDALGNHIEWSKQPVGPQAAISLFALAARLPELIDNLVPEVQVIKGDPVLAELMEAIPEEGDCYARAQIGLEALARLRELGFCIPQSELPQPPVPPQGEDDDEAEEVEDEDGESEQGDDDQGSEDAPGDDEDSAPQDGGGEGEDESQDDPELPQPMSMPGGEDNGESDSSEQEDDDAEGDDDQDEGDDDQDDSDESKDSNSGITTGDKSEGDSEEESDDETGKSGKGQGEDQDEDNADDAEGDDAGSGDDDESDDEDDPYGDDDDEADEDDDNAGNGNGQGDDEADDEESDEDGEGDSEADAQAAKDEMDRKEAEEVNKTMRQMMGHEDKEQEDGNYTEPEDGYKPHAPEDRSNDQTAAIDEAVKWQKFDAPPKGIRDFYEQEADPWVAKRYGPIDWDPGLVSGETAHLRAVFALNRKRRLTGSLKKGSRLDSPNLHRIASEDYRIFGKQDRPDKRDWFVLVGLDDSASTHSNGAASVIRELGLAIGEMLTGVGIKFAMYGHGGLSNNPSSRSGHDGSWAVRHLIIKSPDEPWTPESKDRLSALGRDDCCNYDGHTLEQYRKIIQTRRETDKMILYVTDGAMPMMNFDEELEVLQRELQILRRQRVHLVGVGYRTDSPKQHGMDTISIQDGRDLPSLVHGLRERLESA